VKRGEACAVASGVWGAIGLVGTGAVQGGLVGMPSGM